MKIIYNLYIFLAIIKNIDPYYLFIIFQIICLLYFIVIIKKKLYNINSGGSDYWLIIGWIFPRLFPFITIGYL